MGFIYKHSALSLSVSYYLRNGKPLLLKQCTMIDLIGYGTTLPRELVLSNSLRSHSTLFQAEKRKRKNKKASAQVRWIYCGQDASCREPVSRYSVQSNLIPFLLRLFIHYHSPTNSHFHPFYSLRLFSHPLSLPSLHPPNFCPVFSGSQSISKKHHHGWMGISTEHRKEGTLNRVYVA